MNNIRHLTTGLLSSLFLAAGMNKIAAKLDPLAQGLTQEGDVADRRSNPFTDPGTSATLFRPL